MGWYSKESKSSFGSMKSARRLLAFAVASLAIATVAASAHGTIPMRVMPSRVTVKNVTPGTGMPAFSLWRPRTIRLAHAPLNMSVLRQQARVNATVPFWTSVITSPLDRRSYTTSMVGSSPFATPGNTNIVYVPIVVRFHFRDGTVLDPTQPACNDTVPITTRFFNSPLFQPQLVSSNGVQTWAGTAGGTQLIDAFQRANFWTNVGGTGYGVTLVPSRTTPIIVDTNVNSTPSRIPMMCNGFYKVVRMGSIDINTFDNFVVNLVRAYALPSQLPIVLTYNMVQTESGFCCILGYHNAMPVSGGTMTYAVGSYLDSGIFSGVDDIVVWEHELGEWMDDPFVGANVPGGGYDDLTPAWGNVGQVSGCQNDLETGDPLSGTEFALQGADGFNYHLQDLAFEDWFYRTPSKGTGGFYSFQGVFTNTQRTCR